MSCEIRNAELECRHFWEFNCDVCEPFPTSQCDGEWCQLAAQAPCNAYCTDLAARRVATCNFPWLDDAWTKEMASRGLK